jgi:DNA-binding transcriptional regulator YdaS (Cro superfamily)
MNRHPIEKACAIVGGQTALARLIGVATPTVNQWVKLKRPIPAVRCPAIERATSGLVRCEDLRPDVDWGFLRNTPAVNPENSPNLEEAA